MVGNLDMRLRPSARTDVHVDGKRTRYRTGFDSVSFDMHVFRPTDCCGAVLRKWCGESMGKKVCSLASLEKTCGIGELGLCA